MAKKTKINFSLDREAENFLKNLESKLPEAREKALEAAGIAWADEAKMIARRDQHIETGTYVNSIGYVTDFSGPKGAEAGTPIHEITLEGEKTNLEIGSAVVYAGSLEKQFNIMGAALDSSLERMQTVANEQIKRVLLK